MRAIIGLGSNLGDSLQTLTSALTILGAAGGVQSLKVSSFYKTKPWGYADQPDFINAAALLETKLKPAELLNVLQTIENAHHRVRNHEHYGPRTLDLDIIDYEGVISKDPLLTLPHPRAGLRAFVLVPLLELDENFIFADGKKAFDLYAALSAEDKDGILRLAPSSKA